MRNHAMTVFFTIIAFVLSWSTLLSAQGADFTRPWASDSVDYNVDTMTLWTPKLIQSQFQARIPLANGYAGISSAAEGPFFAADKNLTDSQGTPPIEGWPLFNPRQTFATITGFWDEQPDTPGANFPELFRNGGESVISGIPHWSDLIFTTGDGQSYVAGVDNETVTNFNSSLNMKDAVATWSLSWTPGEITFNLTYQLFLSHAEGRENLAAVRLDIVSSEDHNGTVTDLLDGRSALRSTAAGKGLEPNDKDSAPTNLIWAAVKPNGLDDVIAYVYSAMGFTGTAVDQDSRREVRDAPYVSTNASTIAQQFDVRLKNGKTTTFFKYIGIASSVASLKPRRTRSLHLSSDPKSRLEAVARSVAPDAHHPDSSTSSSRICPGVPSQQDCPMRSHFTGISHHPDSNGRSMARSAAPNGNSHFTGHSDRFDSNLRTNARPAPPSENHAARSAAVDGDSNRRTIARSAPPSENHAARSAALHGKETGWDDLLAESKSAWSKKFNDRVIEDYRDADGKLPSYWAALHITTVAQNFYLLQNLPSPSSGSNISDRSISVGGLTSDTYAGLVFWDADIFVSPAILATKPQYAQSIARYRLSTFPQAKRNAMSHGLSNASAIYPWTSSRYGNCTATGPCFDYQYHLNGDIVLNLFNTYLATGNMTFLRHEAFPVMAAICSMYAEILRYNRTTNLYELRNMTDPDEYANHIDNGAFTMGLIGRVLNITQQVLQLLDMPTVPTWTQIATGVNVPRDLGAGIIKEYDTMNNSLVAKQADVILLNYPAGYIPDSAEAVRSLDWYAQAQSADGPAMTFANYMISAAELSLSGCSALTYAFNSFEPYVRSPFYQFSEQQDDDPDTNGGTRPAYPFLTGSGGLSQLAPYGFLGYRPQLGGLYLAPWSVPHLDRVRIRDIVYMGATFQVSMNSTHTTVTRVSTQGYHLVDANANGTVSVIDGNDPKKSTFPLAIGQSVTLKNRATHDIKTIPNDILQCLRVTSSNRDVSGQIPEGAVDGANSTKWQPATPDAAAITVDLASDTPPSVEALFFNWAQAPPTGFSVSSSNTSDGEFVELYSTKNVTISNPHTETDVFNIRPKQGNVTSVTFSPTVQPGRYVRLTIEGTQGVNNETGATVAVFAMIGNR